MLENDHQFRAIYRKFTEPKFPPEIGSGRPNGPPIWQPPYGQRIQHDGYPCHKDRLVEQVINAIPGNSGTPPRAPRAIIGDRSPKYNTKYKTTHSTLLSTPSNHSRPGALTPDP